MIDQLAIYCSESTDPYYNLALEQHLLDRVGDGECILYLWQNENTVVIGRNQNPWKECNTTLLTQEGGHLVRRLSGGGAVYHDLGNLNFTFLMPQQDFDLKRQLSVIQTAVSSMGVPVEFSGRNDLLACGRKFSGNAFYKNGKQAYHHGTLLVNVDMERLSRYLTPSKAKLQSKGVDSVRSRVVNLNALNAGITISSLKASMMSAFQKIYDRACLQLGTQHLDLNAVKMLTQRNRSWEWNYGVKMPFTYSSSRQYPWGNVEIAAQIEGGHIVDVCVYSDAMDWQLPDKIRRALVGKPFEETAVFLLLDAMVPEIAPGG